MPGRHGAHASAPPQVKIVMGTWADAISPRIQFFE